MKKELDKELYPDYVYPEFTPDPNEPFREPVSYTHLTLPTT